MRNMKSIELIDRLGRTKTHVVKYYIEHFFTNGKPTEFSTGPYTIEEAFEQLKDVQGYEGVYDAHVAPHTGIS